MADTPLRADADPAWRELNQLATDAEPQVREVFLAAIRALVAGVAVRELLTALSYRDPTRALTALKLETLAPTLAELVGVLETIAADAARSAVSRLARAVLGDQNASLILRLGGGLPRAEVSDWARAHGLALARDLSAETRYALQNIIADAMQSGLAPAQTARLIEQVIGLTQRQAAALVRYRDTLITAGIDGGRLERMVSRYSERLLRLRARAIARTETITAANAGNLETWRRNVREGVLDPDRWLREWIAVADPRTCPDCGVLDGQRVKISEPFISPAYGEVEGPALHSNCRCSVVLVRAGS